MNFYDTNVLLQSQELCFKEAFVISSVTINELEEIKTSKNKSEEVKFQARNVCRLLDTNSNLFHVVLADKNIHDLVDKYQLPVTPDNLIIASASLFLEFYGNIVFVSNDIAARLTAKQVFELPVDTFTSDFTTPYKGYVDAVATDDEIASLYEHPDTNIFKCITNEYVTIKDATEKVIDVVKWDGLRYIPILKKSLKTMAFGDKIKPKDEYQQMAIDSIMTNTMTIISGRAGSGKSLMSLLCAMNLIETGKYDRLVILYNATKVRGAADTGFYPGTANEKAMSSGIGEILSSKFGDRYAVDILLSQNKIKLLSMADCRGAEIRDNEILYISEAENTSVDLLKLCLSRASQGAKIIIEGDYVAQVDSYAFEGNKNGMRRAIDVLKGENIFGYVDLPNVHRSKIAELVQKM